MFALEDLQRLEIGHLAKLGVLTPGRGMELTWESGSYIRTEASQEGLRLIYSCGGKAFDYRVLLSWTACNYGGERPWFLCPAIGCSRRVSVLRLRGGVFVCRHCTGLLYTSQLTAANWRAKDQEWKLRRALGIKPGDIRPAYMIPRAKGRHQKTHDRLIAKLERLELLAAANSWAMIKRLQRRVETCKT